MPSQTFALGQAYIQKGWSIIPVRASDKIPQIEWRAYVEKRATSEDLAGWLEKWPDMNLGIVTGAISGLAVIDLDGPDGLVSGEKLQLMSPLTVWTGKGRHLYFRHPGEKVCNSVRKFPGVDVRGDGGYVLAPPSLHPNGKAYSWASAVNAVHLPPFPVSLFATKQSASPSTSAKPAGWIAEALGGISNDSGNRNNVFAQVAGKLHGQRWSADDIRSLLLPHALRVQFPEVELDTVIRSITRYPVTVTGRNGQATSYTPGQLPAVLNVRTFGKDWAEYERRRAGIKNGEFPTGYKRLDSLLNGGLVRERLFRIAARTGVGKTNWLLAMCASLCRGGKRVLYMSTELSYETIWGRYIPVVGSESEARSHKLDVSDDFTPDSTAIRTAIEELKPDVFVFDHIHNVSEEHSEVAAYIRMLGQIAKDFKMPGVVAAQLNKDAYFIDQKTGKRITPHMGMVKGSSAILEVPGQVLILDEQDETPDQRDILGVLDKNTDGEKGLINFVLRKHPYRMEEL